MTNLICRVCGAVKEIPTCCSKSMVLQDGLLCCCTDECHHSKVPECCGEKMSFMGGY